MSALNRPSVPAPSTPRPSSPIGESESRFRTMADHAPVLLWMARPDGECEFFNQRWLDFTGRSLEQEVGVGWAEGVHPEDLQHCMHTYFDALIERESFTMEYRLRRRDSEYRWIYDQGAPRYDADGGFAGYIGSCVDITEQRQSREALEQLTVELEKRVAERTALAAERETLLRAVHHRVKNDLQLISSTLSMQQRRLTDATARAALEECNGRIETIALIHEHMYSSDNLERLSFSQNVRSMSAGLFRAADPRPHAVELEVDVEDDIWLPVDRAIPGGLILNELLRNALKHAFPGDRAGVIRVRLARQEQRVVLTVADDGVGFSHPDAATRDAASLGWRLVDAFVEQLGAKLDVDHQGGLSVSVGFSDNGAAS